MQLDLLSGIQCGRRCNAAINIIKSNLLIITLGWNKIVRYKVEMKTEMEELKENNCRSSFMARAVGFSTNPASATERNQRKACKAVFMRFLA